ncbi:MAG: sulfotransferase family 2 domain-containing protein [Planctomycetota bacterium]
MIVSHKHRFIFVHCRKVAGSSIKVALAPHLGDDDIVIGSMNEIMKAGGSMNRAARKALYRPAPMLKALAARLAGRSWPEAANIGIKSYYKGRLSVNPPHPSAAEMASFFPEEWNSYYKFAFVRNPFERVVSDYQWRSRSTKKELPFEDYVRQLEQPETRGAFVHAGGVRNMDMIMLDGRIAVDAVGKFETLVEDFSRITAEAGIKGASLGTREKRSPRVDLHSFYGPEQIEIVSRIFKDELEAFGYELPFDQAAVGGNNE